MGGLTERLGVILLAVCLVRLTRILRERNAVKLSANKMTLNRGYRIRKRWSQDHAPMMTRPPHRPTVALAGRQRSCGFPRWTRSIEPPPVPYRASPLQRSFHSLARPPSCRGATPFFAPVGAIFWRKPKAVAPLRGGGALPPKQPPCVGAFRQLWLPRLSLTHWGGCSLRCSR